MESLSTEIDEMVLGYLPTPSLNTLSMTSKYYRTISEPHLYKNIVFASGDTYGIFNLLFSLLNRRELAQHIRSFTLLKEDLDDDESDADIDPKCSVGEALHSDVWMFVPKINELIDELCVDETFAFAMRWLGNVIEGGISYDGALALILCLAHKIQHLGLATTEDRLYITLHVMNKRWKHYRNEESSENLQATLTAGGVGDVGNQKQGVHHQGKATIPNSDTADDIEYNSSGTAQQNTTGTKQGSFPFCSLETLRIYGPITINILILPWLSTMEVESVGELALVDIFSAPYENDNLGTQLQVLRLSGVSNNTHWYSGILAYSEFRKLKELRVRGARHSEDWVHGTLQDFIDDLGRHHPLLEVLEFYDYKYEYDGTPQSDISFRGLGNLRTLKVDSELLVPLNDHIPVHFQDSTAYFPTCPENLVLTNIDGPVLDTLVLAYKKRTEPTDRSVGLERLLNAVAAMTLKKVDLYVDMYYGNEPQLDDITGKVLCGIINSLAGVGVEMRVWRLEGHYGKSLLHARLRADMFVIEEEHSEDFFCDQ
jgi:hypothetical protein